MLVLIALDFKNHLMFNMKSSHFPSYAKINRKSTKTLPNFTKVRIKTVYTSISQATLIYETDIKSCMVKPG